MRQRRPWSRSVSPEHFGAVPQICTRAALHSRPLFASPPRFPTLARTCTRSDTRLWMTVAHRFGRLSPSPLAATPPGPPRRENCLWYPSAPSRTRQVGRRCSPPRCCCFPCSPASMATTVQRGSSRRHPQPPLHRRLPRHLCILHPDATSPPSQLVAPPFPVHATCWPDASQGTSHAPITSCARGRSVAPAPVLLPPHPRDPSFAFTFLRVRHLAPPPTSPHHSLPVHATW